MKYFYILVSFLLYGTNILASDGFKATKIIKKESVSAEKMIIIAYISFFILVLGYILFINKRINQVNKKLNKLESLHEENRET